MRSNNQLSIPPRFVNVEKKAVFRYTGTFHFSIYDCNVKLQEVKITWVWEYSVIEHTPKLWIWKTVHLQCSAVIKNMYLWLAKCFSKVLQYCKFERTSSFPTTQARQNDLKPWDTAQKVYNTSYLLSSIRFITKEERADSHRETLAITTYASTHVTLPYISCFFKPPNYLQLKWALKHPEAIRCILAGGSIRHWVSACSTFYTNNIL